MTKLAGFWIGLAALYAAFLAWHQPLRGPLIESEVKSAFGEQYFQLEASENPRAARLLDFFLSDDGRPFYMVNLNALPEHSTETAEAARAYAAHIAPRILSRASYPVLWSDPLATLNNSIGADLDAIERLIVVRYRSRRDFLAIIATPEFLAALKHKNASLDGWYAAPAPVQPVLSPPQLALIALIAIGLFRTALVRRQKPAARATDGSGSH